MRKLFRWFWSKYLATTEGRLKLFIMVAGFFLFSIGASIVALQATSQADFCATCHEMRPEYVTWKASAHNTVSCVKCHIEPGLDNFVRHKIESLRQLYVHFTESYTLPITIPYGKEIENEVCMQCHSVKRVVTPSGDITLPHYRHAEKGILCVDCHEGVAHGRIAKRQLTLDGNFEAWTEATGRAQMIDKYTKPRMVTCMECHRSKGIDTGCDACHKKLGDPESHQVANWLTTHGKLAEKDLENCKKCHSYANVELNLEDPIGGTVNAAAEYARRNPFCGDCHSRRPPSHRRDDWLIEHAAAAEPDSSSCLVCHNVGKPTAAGKTTKTYCNQCHTGQHRGNWRQQHPVTVRVEGGVRAECFTCHSQRQCARCHMAGEKEG
ncbi:cytochrome c3 family protein, partial [Calderihabitans maritimus]